MYVWNRKLWTGSLQVKATGFDGIIQTFVPVSPFSTVGREVPFYPTGFSKVWELCTRYNLSLRAQPTQSAEEPNYAPRFNEPCHTLSHPPRPLSSSPPGLLSPAVRSTSSVFPVGVLLGVVSPPLAQKPCSAGLWGGCGTNLPLLLEPGSTPTALPGTAGLCNPCLIHGQFFFMERSCALGSGLKSTKFCQGICCQGFLQ